ncbi:MAG: hypothetical protein P8Y45_22015 [Exilibacterium sp.]
MSKRDIDAEILEGIKSMRTLQDWEQGRRAPQGPAVALLRIAEQHPEVFAQLH